MKIYLAARFGRKAEMHDIAKQLRDCGHVVVSRWVDVDDAPLYLAAAMDLLDVTRAEVLLSFTEEHDALDKGQGGRHVELGLALAFRLRCMCVGPREHVFHHLPDVEFYVTLDAALAALPKRT